MTQTLIACVAAVVLLSSCGGDKSATGTSPSTTPAATITITASGVSPKSVTVPRGSQVEFVNSDGQPHDMTSNPHPEHTDCPELNAVGFLSPGQRRQSGNLNTPRTCGYHDHGNPDRVALQGSIVVQ
ncbi:MAG TPA: hypothetical protein VM032_10000 [Vicinamibacterales bacterium]|nr:hypothetical protein [Vicinamibacterales bacterium]